MTIPQSGAGLPASPGLSEDPFHCLLEDDYLITEIKVTTDRLLTPAANPVNKPDDVELVVHVRTTFTESLATLVTTNDLYESDPKYLKPK